MQTWIIWEIVGVLFLIIEMFTPTTFFAGLGLGALLAGLVAWLKLKIFWQLIIFALVSILFTVYLRPLFKDILFSNKKELNNLSIYEDKQAKVIVTIDNAQDTGRIRVFDEEWPAKSIENKIIEKDSIVIIKYIKSMTMYVISK